MPGKQPVVFTFHKIREQAEQADHDAWRAFLNFYGPLWQRLLEIYGPGDAAANSQAFEALLRRLSENSFERFRVTPRQSEREFLADVRGLLFDAAAASSGTAVGAADGETFDAQKLKEAMDGLPLRHQEILFFRFSGYADGTIERVLRVAPRVAEKAFERLPAAWSAAPPPEQDRCPRPAEWLPILREIREAKGKDCPDPHKVLRIHDGQVSWYDKEPVEKHVAGCLHCLEYWTAMLEVAYWRRVAAPLGAAEVERLLGTLPLAAAPEPSFLARVFGRP